MREFTLAETRDRVRTLTGVWSIDVVSNDLLNTMIEDAVTALARSQQWSTTGVGSVHPVPVFAELRDGGNFVDTRSLGENWVEYHPMIGYRVASQVLAFEADDTNRAAFFAQEYDKMYNEMLIHFLPNTASGVVADTVSIVRYVRDLTGQYGQDLTDKLVRAWLDEVYQELYATYVWQSTGTPFWSIVPPATSPPSLRANNPTFSDTKYNSVLAYRVASKIMAAVPEMQQRAALYRQEYETLFAAMLSDFFPRPTVSTLSNQLQLTNHVRFLTSNYTRALSDGIIEQYLREAQKELLSKNYWPSSVTSTFIDGIPADYRRILSLRASIRILNGVPGQEALVASFGAEYEAAVDEMKDALVRNATLGAASSVTFGDLKSHVRTLTGTWDYSVSDTAIGNWLNDAYTELAQDKNWPWLEQTATTDFSLPAGSTTQALPNGTRRVMGVYFVGGNYDGVPDQWLAVPHLLDVEKYAPRTVYDIADDGILRWSPELPEAGVLRVQYVRNIVPFVSDSDQPLFATRFRAILAYRAAMRWASMNGDKNRVETFQSEYQSTFEQMVNEYLLDHDTNPMQIGSRGLETRRYLPWFRTS
jgi:hypothetical protein